VIQLDNYTWYGFNRQEIHVNAPKASGGVGLLVKTQLTEQFNIFVVDRSYDGILALKFEHRITSLNLIVFSCYLPPEGSTRGRDAQSFFAHLLAQIYLHSDADSLIIAADFNARIGNLSDILNGLDSIPERRVLDRNINQHGHDCIEFLNDSKLCVLNGRFTDENYTSISRKGKAVVDYLCVPHDVLVPVNRSKC
jgi:hypothetical protein